MSTLFEVGAGGVADTNDDWYTPPWVFDAAGIVFDLDVAAPVDPSRRTCPARSYLTPVEDGLAQPWQGVVWMNPPFSGSRPWVERFAEHRSGLALLPASNVAGALWQHVNHAAPFALGAALALLAALLFIVLLPARRERGDRDAG